MSTEGDDGPSAEPGAEAGGIGGGRGSSRKTAGATTTKYSERSTNSRSLEDSDSVVDEAQPALGLSSLSLSPALCSSFIHLNQSLQCHSIKKYGNVQRLRLST